MCERCALGVFGTVAVACESGRAYRLVVLDLLQTKCGSRLPEEAICFGSIFLIGEIRQTGIPGDMLLPGVAKRILGFDFGDLTLVEFHDIADKLGADVAFIGNSQRPDLALMPDCRQGEIATTGPASRDPWSACPRPHRHAFDGAGRI